MRVWSYLKKGDVVDLVAPGYPADAKLVSSGKRTIESWGLHVREPIDLIRPHFFHAQTDQRRFEILDEALRNNKSKAVWCVRGGYGAGRILPLLLKKKAPKLQKMFIGISDNTVLHCLLNQNWKWPSLHGPIVEKLGPDQLPTEIIEQTRAIIFGEKKEIVFEDLQPLNIWAEKRKKIEGVVLGGNLATYQTLIGTSLHPKTRNAILFFEDIGERGYRIDRMLEHFKQARVFDKCEAIVFGNFTGGDEPEGAAQKSFVQFALERFAENVKFPVFQGLKAGHGLQQWPVPFAMSSKIVNKKLTVQLLK